MSVWALSGNHANKEALQSDSDFSPHIKYAKRKKERDRNRPIAGR